MKKLILIFVLLISVSSTAQFPNYEEKIDSLLSVMTLDEKVGQMIEIVGPQKITPEQIRNGELSSVLGVKDAKTANRLQKIAVEESRLGIPLIFANDVIHGFNTTFPIPLAEAASFNPELIKRASEIAAFEAAAHGTHWTFAPMVDIARDPRWGRIAEGSGEDPYLGSVLAKARVEGFQGNNLRDKKSIAACAKHYAAYGAAEGGRDYNSVDMSERTLREIYLPPFKSAIDAGVVTLMSAFNDLNGIPASANHFLMTDILRDEWNFKGFVISDYNSIGELVYHGFAEDKAEAAMKAVNSGVDMDMVGDIIDGDAYAPHLKKLVENNLVDEKTIDESVRRILRVKFRLGLFENPYVDTVFYNENEITFEEKQETALQLAKESIVLLKNEYDLLPLKKI